MPFVNVTDIVLNEEAKEVEESYRNDPEVKAALDQFEAECRLRGELAAARKEKSITQKEIEELTGLSQQAISRIENNKDISPTLKNLIKYVDAIGYQVTIVPKQEEAVTK